jgi:hypothetical protein
MKVVIAVLLAVLAGSEARLSCEECTMEMHKLGGFVKAYAPTITQFLKDNYCPEINSPDCGNHLDEHYPKILFAVVDHFFVDRAVHMCQLMHACPYKNLPALFVEDAFTCDDCTRGLEYIRGYMLDQYVIDEMVVYLEHNFCTPQMEGCPRDVARHFPAMHEMAMTEFFIPLDICTKAGPCQA